MTNPIESTALAEEIGAEHVGPPVTISGTNALDAATGDELAFAVYDQVDPIERSDAGAVICRPEIAPVPGRSLLVVDNPRLGFAKLSQRYFSDDDSQPGVHPTAVVDDRAEIGNRVRIGANVFLDGSVRVGDDCVIRAGATLGCSGFGFERDDTGRPVRLAHRGGVSLGDGVEIGPNATIDRGVFHDTSIGSHSKLSANVHLAHEVTIGEDALLTFGVGFGGGSSAGDGVEVHPNAAIAEGVSLGNRVTVGMGSSVLDDVPDGTTVVGSPARAIDGGLQRVEHR